MKKGYCDNTNCHHLQSTELEVFEVEMLPEFDGGKFNWCTDCIKRDGDMIVQEKE